jgi:hypothetical protein
VSGERENPGPGTDPGGEPPRGGCLNLGWGCLPVLVLLLFPTGLWLA